MAGVKEHYDKHLSNFYSWMAGDFELLQESQGNFFAQHNILPGSTAAAIDLGAGHGAQSTALAKLGFHVTAIDFSAQLLAELGRNSRSLPVETVEDDIRNVSKYSYLKPELIVCMGDTLTHLESADEVERLVNDCAAMLQPGGRLVLSFRDYTRELKGNDRFIPVKNDGNRILTVFLEYFPGKVSVTDLLFERSGQSWEQKVSTYDKLRLDASEVSKLMVKAGLKVEFNEPVNRMICMVGVNDS
jgi:SAM-dependent methyltransferase